MNLQATEQLQLKFMKGGVYDTSYICQHFGGAVFSIFLMHW